MLTQSLVELADIHNQQRWHKCPDGYRWRILPNAAGNGYVGTLLGSGDGQLARVEHQSRERVEESILRYLDDHRRG